MKKPRQLPIKFPAPKLGLKDFILTEANRGAIEAALKPAAWPHHVFCLIGPIGSGLSTLSYIWADELNGLRLSAERLSAMTVGEAADLSAGYIVVDEADAVNNDQNLLLLISAVGRLGGRLLLTGHKPPSQWDAATKDLASRLQAAPLVQIGPPDEPMMRARLKAIAKAQYMDMPRAVEDYLLVRIGLRYDLVVPVIDALAGAVGGRELTVPVAREILEYQPELFDGGRDD
ncbi:MAG: hypothetical protein AAGH90_08490 [Pseudomonadota bacterium]